VKEGVKAIAALAFTLTVLNVLIGVTDEASRMVWQSGRPDLVRMIEGMVSVATVTGPLSTTFVGPLVLLFGFLGLIGLVVSLMMRSHQLQLREPRAARRHRRRARHRDPRDGDPSTNRLIPIACGVPPGVGVQA
jgi:hypothetical protein